MKHTKCQSSCKYLYRKWIYNSMICIKMLYLQCCLSLCLSVWLSVCVGTFVHLLVILIPDKPLNLFSYSCSYIIMVSNVNSHNVLWSEIDICRVLLILYKSSRNPLSLHFLNVIFLINIQSSSRTSTKSYSNSIFSIESIEPFHFCLVERTFSLDKSILNTRYTIN